MEINDQCTAIGIPADGVLNGLPTLGNKYCLWGDDGLIHVYKSEPLKPWQAPTEITESIPEDKRLKIKALALGEIETLSQAEQDALVAAELVEAREREPAGKLRDTLYEFIGVNAERQYGLEPAFLAQWHAYVDALWDGDPKFFRSDL